MKELEYPFNSEYLIRNKRKLKRLLLEDGNKIWTEIRVAILGGSTTSDIKKMLELFLLNYGLKPFFYESEYNQYYQEAVFHNGALTTFKPDIIYIHTSNRNITSFPELKDNADIISSRIEEEYGKFISVWDSLAEKYHCPIIQNNFEMPFYRLLGNKDASDIHGAVNFLTRLNLKFYEYAQSHDSFFICDINYISADYGLRDWANPFYWYMYKYALNVNAIPYLAFNVSNIIKSILGKNKKGFVLDLDNTLWGGIVGDDGVENIKMGPEESSGQVYAEFQCYVKAHKQLGILLNINSKNDEKNALDGLNRPDCELKPDDFTVIKANWDSKDRNFLGIASELNLLPESMVFIDDNPAERHIIEEQISGVSVPEIGESHQYIQNIDRNGYFEATYLSADDFKRNEMYVKNVERLKLQSNFSDYGEYLDSLEMKAVIKSFEPMYMERIAQLTNKSNQFNLTTKRYTYGEIESIVQKGSSYITLYGKLVDRFGDNGLVAVCIGRVEEKRCHIELWLMSCRVLKRDMEYAMMDALVRKCQDNQINEIIGYYYPTTKNGMVKDFYSDMGFKLESNDCGNTVWSFFVTDNYIEKNIHIQMEEAE